MVIAPDICKYTSDARYNFELTNPLVKWTVIQCTQDDETTFHRSKVDALVVHGCKIFMLYTNNVIKTVYLRKNTSIINYITYLTFNNLAWPSNFFFEICF